MKKKSKKLIKKETKKLTKEEEKNLKMIRNPITTMVVSRKNKILPMLEHKKVILTKIVKKKTEVRALGKHIPLSADKARRVIDQIRGRSYEETLMRLELMPYGACYEILKLVYSAAANASYKMGSSKANLVISKAEVNRGTTAKKFKPRARGRSYGIKKPTCHITIVVKDISLDEFELIEF